MAISLGVYEDLIELLSSFYKIKIIKKHFKFIIGMILGLIISVILFMKLFYVFPTLFLALFIGFMLSSIFRKNSEEKNTFIGFSIKIVIIILLFCLNLIGNYRLPFYDDKITIFNIFITFFLSMVASIAFILPGISGSMLMFIFGLYDKILKSFKLIIDSTNKFRLLTDENFLVIIVIILGFLVGILAFSKIIDKFLKKFPRMFLTISDGFLKGSFLILVVELIKCIDDYHQIVTTVLFIIIGFVIERKFITNLKK